MKYRIGKITILFILLFLIIATASFSIHKSNTDNEISAQYTIDLNEIEQLSLKGDYELMSEKIQELETKIKELKHQSLETPFIILLALLCVSFILVVFIYIYHVILKPFEQMKIYAGEISAGNFELPLDFERANYFGDFTWAFDHMRQEITKARSCEREAIENNKTVIATLSHDIKTPIASIRWEEKKNMRKCGRL